MNNKGFTLVEVIAVVVILSIVGAIAVPSVTHILKENKVKNCENLKKSIISACGVYVSDNRNTILNDKSCSDNKIDFFIPLSNLELDSSNGIKNPINDEVITSDVSVTFNCTSKRFTCSYDLSCDS